MTKAIKLLTILVLGIAIFSNENNITAQSSIKSIKISGQKWMVKNLDVTQFRNGEEIHEAKSNEEWDRAVTFHTPAWCYYENNPETGKKFGKLYNWYAVNDNRGLAPNGWHMPTKTDFETLKENIQSGNALKAVGQGIGNGVGTNKSGFSALLAGYRDGRGPFYGLGKGSLFWSSTELGVTTAYDLTLMYDDDIILLLGYFKAFGFSVRCLKD